MIKCVRTIILLITGAIAAAAQPDSLAKAGDFQFFNPISTANLDSDFTDRILKQNSLSQIVDNYVDDAHVHFESTAGYDAPNPYLISFMGASYKWTKHSYDGFRIDNPLLPGDAAHHFTLAGVDLGVNSIGGSLDVQPIRTAHRRVTLTGGTGSGLGGRVGFTDWFLNNISGHRSAFERQIFDIQQRPYSRQALELSYRDGSDTSALVQHLSVSYGNRVHVDQDHLGVNTSYDEQYLRAAAHGTLTTAKHALGDGLHYMFSYGERDHFGAEYQYSRAETAKLVQLNASLYTNKRWSEGSQVMGLHINALRKAQVDRFFSKNILDQDGEGLEPYHQDGRQQSYGVYFKREQQLASNISFATELNNTLINHMPQHEQFSNAMFMLGPEQVYATLYQVQWQSQQFLSGLLENNISATYESGAAGWQLRATGGLHLLGMLVAEANKINVAPSVDVGLTKELGSHWILGLRTGIQPNRYDVDQIRFLSKDYLNGEAYYWTDRNNDQLAQGGELGNLSHTTGGAYRRQSDELGVSRTVFVEVPIQYKPSSRWLWSLVPQYRSYRGTWSVEHTPGTDTYTDQVLLGDQTLQVIAPGVRDYTVQPVSKERMGANGPLFDQPFYAGVTFRFEHRSRRWFFSGSMTANMIVGYAGMGNGPLHNNINALSETTADVNLRINQVGRLDSDRSFISRIVADYRYGEHGSVGVLLKYKDGQSFSYYPHHLLRTLEGNKISFYKPEVRGDNPLTGDRGRREDFFTNFELRWQHSWSVADGRLSVLLTGHNLLDFANETSEYIFGNTEGFSRSPLELQVPRSISLQLGYTW